MTELTKLAGASVVEIRSAMTARALGPAGGFRVVTGKLPLPGKVMRTAK